MPFSFLTILSEIVKQPTVILHYDKDTHEQHIKMYTFICVYALASPANLYNGVILWTDPTLTSEDVLSTGHRKLCMCVCVCV